MHERTHMSDDGAVLEELMVSNLGIIGSAHLEPARGLVVVTGETGTGKTMLLGALGLLLGATGRRELVGPDGDEATAQARLAIGGDEVIVARRISREGRSRAYLDGMMAPVRAIAERTDGAVDLVAQHDHLRLTRPAEVRSLIDGVLDTAGRAALDDYRQAWDVLEGLRKRQEAIGGDMRALERELETVRHHAKEIEAAGFAEGDDEVLAASAARLRNVRTIVEGLAEAAEALGESGAEPTVDRSVLALTRSASHDPSLQPLVDQAVDIGTLLSELRGQVAAAAEEIWDDPVALADVEERLAMLGGLIRKYGESLADVLAFGEESAARAAELEGIIDDAASLEVQLAAASRNVVDRAAVLAGHRRTAAEHLAGEAVSHLRELGFTDPHVTFRFAGTEPGPDGAERCELLFASDTQLEPGPVARIASGGELSRLVLALRLAAGAGAGGVVAFDEIDAGVGGAVALALGRKLAHLAGSRQVLCVTHLPQVAAFATTHYVVEREGPTASVREVDGAERVEELTRMLAGMPDSARGKEHAAELLAMAHSD
jgi:DNA repair protein RecN (Recombination protein N)